MTIGDSTECFHESRPHGCRQVKIRNTAFTRSLSAEMAVGEGPTKLRERRNATVKQCGRLRDSGRKKVNLVARTHCSAKRVAGCQSVVSRLSLARDTAGARVGAHRLSRWAET